MLLHDDRLKHIAETSADTQQLALLQVGLHGLVVGMLLNEALVELPVKLRRGYGEVWLAHDDEELRRDRELRQQLAAPLDQNGAAHDAERNVRTDARADLAQCGDGERRVVQTVQRAQHGGRVRAPAAETGLHRNALVDENFKAVRFTPGAGEKGFRRPPREIVRVLRQRAGDKLRLGILLRIRRQNLAVAVHLPRCAGVDADRHVVMQRNGLHDRAQVVVAVFAPVENVQRQIDFGERAFGDLLHYLIFLPSR